MAEYTETDKEMLKETHGHVMKMNREMGEVWGELRWIKWIILGTFGAALIDLVLSFLKLNLGG